MSEDRDEMHRALAGRVMPALRERGFRGSFPHLRRLKPTGTDLLSFQFDKWGGGFVIELGAGPAGDFTTPWGATIAAAKLTSMDVPLTARARLRPGRDGSTESWFRFDGAPALNGPTPFERAATEVLELLAQADAWWRGDRSQPNIHHY